ncbi:MAG: hypothetical protein AAGL66_10425 [Pseudomonadota bacterium]
MSHISAPLLRLLCLVLLSPLDALAAEALMGVQSQQFTDRPIPRFEVDAAWPTMPEDLMIGQVPGLALDSDDNVWILQRPNSLGFSDRWLCPPDCRMLSPRAARHTVLSRGRRAGRLGRAGARTHHRWR